MITLELDQTEPAFRAAVRRARGGVLVLTKKGKPVLAIVDIKDELALEALALSYRVQEGRLLRVAHKSRLQDPEHLK